MEVPNTYRGKLKIYLFLMKECVGIRLIERCRVAALVVVVVIHVEEIDKYCGTVAAQRSEIMGV